MKTNLLVAMQNIVNNPITALVTYYKSSNRINSIGDALEFYVKDILCNSLIVKDLSQKNIIYSKFFSYIGNQNNPPDLIIKNGDALEVKKIESMTSQIALNSSYPKDKLLSSSSMLTTRCRDCEAWDEKDLIYVIGIANTTNLTGLWFIQGSCYAANNTIYDGIKNKVIDGINELNDIDLSRTKELGRINKVDPLGITYLRVRGMWGIENPIKVFDYILPKQSNCNFFVNMLMLNDKYKTFPLKDRRVLENNSSKNLTISKVKIKSPNNPANLLEARFLRFEV